VVESRPPLWSSGQSSWLQIERSVLSPLHASQAALPMVTLKISPCTNVTLTLDWITLFMGDMSEEALRREDEVTVKQRNYWGPGTRRNWPIDSRSQCNLKLNLRHHDTENY
jgi:hypothetical protein